MLKLIMVGSGLSYSIKVVVLWFEKTSLKKVIFNSKLEDVIESWQIKKEEKECSSA